MLIVETTVDCTYFFIKLFAIPLQDRLKWRWAALALVLLLVEVQGFYVPGVAPVEFKKGDKIDVKAVKMTSTHTQLPYKYYSLNFCLPKNGTTYVSENLGEILRGDRYVNN